MPTEHLAELFRQAPGFICILRGPDHVFEFANDSYRRLVGGRDVVGKPLLEPLPEITNQGFPDILDQVYRSGETYTSFETPIQLQYLPGATLEQRFIDFVCQPIKDLQGETTGIFVEGIDVTERVRAQAAVREAESQINRQRRFYETVLTNTPDHAYVFGLDHRFIYANKPLLETLGKTGEGVVGKTFLELGYPDWHAARHDREIEKVVATRQPVRGVVNFTGPLGPRVYDYIFTPVLDEAGEVEAVAGTTRDITDLAHAQQTRERLAGIVDSSDDAILSKDLKGVVSTWNKSAERIFGYSAGEAIGQSIAALVIPGERQEEEADILRRIGRGESIDRLETVRRRKDGSRVEMSVTISPMYKHGRVVGASDIAHDISERMRAERHRELLIHELNHRVKNTLATVQSLALHSLRSADSVTQGYAAFEARLLALSRTHSLLTREDWAFVGLRKIVAHATEPYLTPDHAFRFEVNGDALRLQPHAGLALAMALHELATNAVGHGALSGEQGQVRIGWQQSRNAADGQALFRLRWAESGGPRVTPPTRRGFGSRLIQALAQDLRGVVDLRFEPAGVVCEVTAPLARIVAKDE